MDEQFFGRSTVHVTHKNKVWAYDAVTGGIFGINLDKQLVEQFIEPELIRNAQSDAVRGMLAVNDDQLLIIPEHIWHDWTLVNTNTKKPEYINPTKSKTDIAEVVSLDKTAYLIPLRSDEPVVTVTLRGLEEQKVFIEEKNKLCFQSEEAGFTFGSTMSEHYIYCPIVRTNNIYCFQDDEVKRLQIDIPRKIWSICWEEGLWILPGEGEKLYFVKEDGSVEKEVSPFKQMDEYSASDFTRIVVNNQYVHLLPHRGDYVLRYDIDNDDSKLIRLEDTRYWQLLDETVNCSFWDYFTYGDSIWFLPYRYGFAKLTLEGDLKKIRIRWNEKTMKANYWQYTSQYKEEKFFIHEKNKDELQDYLYFI